jgi:predicted Zn-dependent protease
MIGRRAFLVLAALLAATPSTRSANSPRGGLDTPTRGMQTLYDAGQYRQAAEALQAEVERTTKDAALYFWLGRSLFVLHDFSHAISSFEQAIALDPNRSEYHDWLGRACGRKADESRDKMALALSLARRTMSSRPLYSWTLTISVPSGI